MYILNDFKNGIIWYLPLWVSLAGILGALFSPSVQIYRFATLLFGVFSIVLIYLFVKSQLSTKAAFIAALTLAMSPVFIVYSHLMMIEVPLLFSVSLALLFYYRYLTKKKVYRKELLLTLLFFGVGVLTKITAVVLIFGTVIFFGIYVFFFLKNDLIYKRFFSAWTIYFLGSSLLVFGVYKLFTKTYLYADMLIFYLNQNKDLNSGNGSLIYNFFHNFFRNPTFYLRDFLHMPSFFVFILGSLIAYFVLKRNPLSVYLMVWTLVNYFLFSAVLPQAVQYILPVLAPLAVGAGLFWGDFLKHRSTLLANLFFATLTIFIIWQGVFNLDKTETINWRTLITDQEKAAAYIAQNASIGDRIFSIGDGTRFLIRLYGLDKNLQTINGAATVCDRSLNDSSEWALLDYGMQNPIKFELSRFINWSEKTIFKGGSEEIVILYNNNPTKNIFITKKVFYSERCSRYLLPGINEIKIEATPRLKINNSSKSRPLKIMAQVKPGKNVAELIITYEQLKKQENLKQEYWLKFNNQKVNQPIQIVIDAPQTHSVEVSSIEIKNLSF